jgi:hypothetical protein
MAVPEDAKWLNEEERAYVKARLAADQGEAALERSVTLKDVGTAFKDVKLFLGGLVVIEQASRVITC